MTVFFTLANKNQPDIILLRLKASQSVLELCWEARPSKLRMRS